MRPKTAIPLSLSKVKSSPKLKQNHLPYISQEAEQMKGYQLQRTLKKLQAENGVLQNQLFSIEQEKQKFKSKEEGQANKSWLGIKLKIQINQLNSQIEEKESQIRELKKDANYTKAQEQNILIEYLNYCGSMLKTEQPLIPNEIEDLKVEIEDLEITKKLLEEQSENLTIQKSLLEKKISSQYLELDVCKVELKDRERDLRYLRNEIKNYQEKQKVVQQNQKVDVKKKETIDIDDKKAEIIEKDQFISNQESIINQLKEKLQERTNYELKSKNQLIDELQNLNSQIQMMKEELKELNDQYLSEIQPLETEALPIIQGNKDHTFTILHDVYNKQEKKYPRVPRVRQEQVQDIGKELSLRLQLKQISVNEASNILVSGSNSQFVNVEELQEQLLQEPFTIADPNDAKLLARYMIEDNSEEFTYLDPHNCSKIAIVKSVFRHLVGCYALITAEQDRILWEECSNVINKFENSLKSQFELFNKQVVGFMKPQDLFYCLDQLFLDLTDAQKEYVLLRLFAYTNNIQKIMYQKIFDVFKAGAYIDRVTKDNRKRQRQAKKKIEIQKSEDFDY